MGFLENAYGAIFPDIVKRVISNVSCPQDKSRRVPDPDGRKKGILTVIQALYFSIDLEDITEGEAG